MDGFLRVLHSLVSHFVIEGEQARAHDLTKKLCAHFHSILLNNQDLSSHPLLGALNITSFSKATSDEDREYDDVPFANAYHYFRERLRFWLIEWFTQSPEEYSFTDFLESLKELCQDTIEHCRVKKYACDPAWNIYPENIQESRAQIASVYEGICRQKTWEQTRLLFCPTTEVGVVQKFLELLQLKMYDADANCIRRWRVAMALPLEQTIKEYCDEIYGPVYQPGLERLKTSIALARGHDKKQVDNLAKQHLDLEQKYAQHFHDKFPQSFFALLRIALIYDHTNPTQSWSFFQRTCERMNFKINEDEYSFIEGVFRRFRLQSKLDADLLVQPPSLLETHALLYKLMLPMRAQYRELDHLSDLDFFAKLMSWEKQNSPQKSIAAIEFAQILFTLLLLYMRQDENNITLWPEDFKLKFKDPDLACLRNKAFICMLEKQCAEALFFDIRVNQTTLAALAQGIISKPILKSWLAGHHQRDVQHPEQVYGALCLFKPVAATRKAAPESVEDDDEFSDSSLYYEQRDEFKQSKRCTIL